MSSLKRPAAKVAPIDPAFHDAMNGLAQVLDEAFNGTDRGQDRKVGFVLLTFPFGAPTNGRVNYIGNGEREHVRAGLAELLARWDGRYVEADQSEKPQ